MLILKIGVAKVISYLNAGYGKRLDTRKYLMFNSSNIDYIKFGELKLTFSVVDLNFKTGRVSLEKRIKIIEMLQKMRQLRIWRRSVQDRKRILMLGAFWIEKGFEINMKLIR